MKQYRVAPDNSDWIDRTKGMGFILKALFGLCILALFISRCGDHIPHAAFLH